MNKLTEIIKQAPIKALLFDLDDTLYESKEIYDQGLENAWKASLGHPMFSGKAFAEFRGEYSKARHSVKTLLKSSPSRNSRLIYFQFLVQNVLGRPHAELIYQLDKAYSSAYQNINFKPAQKVLKSLKNQYKIGILTNQTLQAQLEKLKRLDPDSALIDYFIVSEAVGVEKPNLRTFDQALLQMKALPDEVLMVGDDFLNDVSGALDAKIHALLLDKNFSADPVLHQAQPIFGTISSLAQLEHLLMN